MTSRPAGGGLRVLALATLAWTFVLVVVGVIVRVTGSGLGCPDWPLCHGQVLPPPRLDAWIEYTHRLSAALATVLVASIVLVAWLRYRWHRPILLLATLAGGLVALQVILGAITVLLELPHGAVTAHLAVAVALLGVLTLLVYRAGALGPLGRPRGLYVIAALAVFLLMLTGAHVRGTGAALACLEWPLCDPLIPGDGALALNLTHRYVAALVGVLVAWAAVGAWRDGLRTHALVVGGLFAVQVMVGAAYIWSGGWTAAQGAHLAFASATWIAVVALAAASARAAVPAGERTSLADYVALTKPPIIVLLLVTALGGMFLAAQGIPPLGLVAAVLVGGSLGAGGANALNHYFDRDIDGLMSRTRRRPLPGHRVAPRDALAFGIALNIAAFVVLAFFANVLAALLTLAAALFYIFVYTLWLKRTTIQNIVIGGAAGAVPPLVGFAAVRGDLAQPAYLLFAIVFFWTPAHFWALALLIKDDYERAGVPMLPVIYGERATARYIVLYSAAVLALSLLLFTTGTVGLLYLIAAVALGVILVAYAIAYLRDAQRVTARRMYLYSMLYLALLFVAIMVDTSLGL